MLKHIKLRIDQAKLLASCSPCPRGQVGAVIYDPESWAVIADGYNGPPRGGLSYVTQITLAHVSTLISSVVSVLRLVVIMLKPTPSLTLQDLEPLPLMLT